MRCVRVKQLGNDVRQTILVRPEQGDSAEVGRFLAPRTTRWRAALQAGLRCRRVAFCQKQVLAASLGYALLCAETRLRVTFALLE